ncbi:MAG TPA: hypothetical protein VFC75_01185, partial [Erysipelothrix sp.]|nr:hypothetical protein [Erysipelothrix sp.]
MKNFISNHKYLIKDLYAYSKTKIHLVWLNVITSTIVVFLGLKLSELVVSFVTNATYHKQMLIQLGWMIFSLTIASLLELFVKTKRFNLAEKYRVSHITKASEVIIDTDFENLLSEDFNEYKRITMDAISGPQSLLGVYIEHITTWLTQIVQLIFIGYFVFMLDLPMVFYVLLLIVSTMIYRTYQAKIIKKQKKEASFEHHKITYLTEKSSNFKVAKDMRLYGVQPWFKEIYESVQHKINLIIFNQTKVILGGQFISGLIITLITGYGYYIFVERYLNNSISLSELTFYTGALSTLLINSTSFVNASFDLIQDSHDITKIRKYYAYVENETITPKELVPQKIKSIEFRN